MNAFWPAIVKIWTSRKLLTKCDGNKNGNENAYDRGDYSYCSSFALRAVEQKMRLMMFPIEYK